MYVARVGSGAFSMGRQWICVFSKVSKSWVSFIGGDDTECFEIYVLGKIFHTNSKITLAKTKRGI